MKISYDIKTLYASLIFFLIFQFGVIDLTRIGLGSLQFPLKVTISLLFLAFILLGFYKSKTIIYTRQILFFLLYIIFSFYSLYWSYSITNTFTALFGAVVILLASLTILSVKLNEVEIAKAIHFSSLVIILSCLLLTPIFTSNFFDFLQGKFRYTGYTYGAHAIARISTLLFISTMYLLWKKKFSILYLLLTLMLSIFIVVITDSRQAYIAALVTVFVFIALKVFDAKYKVYYLYLLSLALFSICIYLILDSLILDLSNLSRTGNIDEIITLTGRTKIWVVVYELIEKKPFLGYGFGAGSEVIMENYSTSHGWTTGSSHNSFLHASLEVGIFFASLLHIILLYSVYISMKNKHYFYFCVCLFTLVICIIERAIAGPVDYLMLLILLTPNIISNYEN